MSQDASADPTAVADTAVVTATVQNEIAREPRTQSPSLVARLGAELFGTFVFVFIGLAAAIFARSQQFSTFEVALVFGIALTAAIAAVGTISGGHFNPAVTLGAAIGGRTSWSNVLPYWVAQILGAVIAVATLFATVPKAYATSTGSSSVREFFTTIANGFGEHSSAALSSQAALDSFYATYAAQGYTKDVVDQAVAAGQLEAPSAIQFDLVNVAIAEIIGVALLVGIILAVTDRRVRSRIAPLVIGLTFAVLLAITAPITGGSLNPVRAFAVALFADGWPLGEVWLFWVAPLAGAAIAGLLYRGFTMVTPVPDHGFLDRAPVAVEDVDPSEVLNSFAPEQPAATPAPRVYGAGAPAAAPDATADAVEAAEAAIVEEVVVEEVAVEEVVVEEVAVEEVVVEEVVVEDPLAEEPIAERAKSDDTTADDTKSDDKADDVDGKGPDDASK